MQIDMHFYGIYALARAAGIKSDIARKIAYASQFVDDAIEDNVIEIENIKAVLPTITSHKPLDYQNTLSGDQWKVWVPFHFIPGNDETLKTFTGKMVCKKNSKTAQTMLEHVLQYKEEPFGPHMIGIAAHAYADTFAHFGFIGLKKKENRVKNDSVIVHVESNSIKKYINFKMQEFQARVMGTMAEKLPVGHASVYTFPDRPYLKWEYQYEDSENGTVVHRNNVEDFLDACMNLHRFFKNYVADNKINGEPVGQVKWDTISDKIRNILELEGSKQERCDHWKNAIVKNMLFTSTTDDNKVSYSENAWKSANIIYHFGKEQPYNECDGCMF
ncbi:MAG: hypothetical protein EHM20_14950, partial [Alphaproteobacteria bacterium]